MILKADSANNVYATFYATSDCTGAPNAYYQPPPSVCQQTDAGYETTDAYAKVTALPQFSGPVQTVTNYLGNIDWPTAASPYHTPYCAHQ